MQLETWSEALEDGSRGARLEAGGCCSSPGEKTRAEPGQEGR